MPDPSAKQRVKEGERTQRAGWALAGVGWEFVSEVLAGVLIGWGVDWYFQTGHKGVIIGAIAGLVVGITTFIRSALRISRSMGTPQRPPEGWKGEKKKGGAGPKDPDEPGNPEDSES